MATREITNNPNEDSRAVMRPHFDGRLLNA